MHTLEELMLLLDLWGLWGGWSQVVLRLALGQGLQGHCRACLFLGRDTLLSSCPPICASVTDQVCTLPLTRRAL